MLHARHWSVRHARGLEVFYQGFERALVALHPLWNWVGYERLERPFRKVERPHFLVHAHNTQP